ncbi:flagellar hook-associated protein FlgK [Polymorphum gilvum]|uniref:Flagellar hook-associated protein 1 n=1 Tax=Polymorphum gilvum (strain LMG 25793 / CGMCC 1.9160 / SL003B-26A1) TaxID=991905 RepID=F2J4P2_POLGS|nr:flagellar hook-associated protein FlgK [Polymorphum gilvum]ADZ72294.1 Flagellar hook-associated protein K [Polymorphum gilvum SL003B-26A1]
MSLSVALQVAQSALAARQTETATVSRNIAGAQDPGYTRKSVVLSTVVSASGQTGGVRVDGIARTTDSALYNSLVRATSVATSQQAIVEGLDKLNQTVSDTELELSPAAALGKLEISIQNYASDPGNAILAQTMLDAAKDMATTLNEYTALVQNVRAEADADMASSVKTINNLLSQLESLNTIIVKGTQGGADVSDALDARDRVLLSLSEEIGISTLTRSDGGVVVYTDGGVTLFETTARTVSFTPTNTYSAATVGNAVYIDGVPVTGANAIMPISSGRLHGLSELRDDIAVTYQSQLDEIARGLIEAFAESDQSGGGGPDQAGLFTYAGAPAVPAASTLVAGLAGDIRISASVDPDQGGNLDLLRDGGISDPLNPDYDYNPGDLAGYSDRLQQFLNAFNQPRVFDGGVELDPTDTLKGFASSSASWLQRERQTATSNLEVQAVIVTRTAESLSNATGVNLDEEMTRLLDIERAYAAAAKLIAAVDRMLEDLLTAAR